MNSVCNSVSGSMSKIHFKYPILIIFIKQNTLLIDERGFPFDEIQFNYTYDIFQTGAKI